MPGDLVRVRSPFRTYDDRMQAKEITVGTLALVISQYTTGGRPYYDVLINGEVWGVVPGSIEPAPLIW